MADRKHDGCQTRQPSRTPSIAGGYWLPHPRPIYPAGTRASLGERPQKGLLRSSSLQPVARSDQQLRGRSAQTAQSTNSHLGWVEIRHPFHPLRGQRFAVLKKRRVAGHETLIVCDPARGTLSVRREWTDQADPSECATTGAKAHYFAYEQLLELIELVKSLGDTGA
jgi:hypothetical protein